MRKIRFGCFLFGWILLASFNIQQVYASEEGKTLFEQKCVACHTLGGGKKVGPDLKNVTERRDAAWLKEFIQSPQSYFTKKDATATDLLKEYGIPMPDLGLKETEVEAILLYLKDSQVPTQAGVTKPSQYLPTIVIGLGAILALTIAGLIAGRKKMEVR